MYLEPSRHRTINFYMALLISAYLGPDIPQLSVNAGPVILQEIWIALRFHDICSIKIMFCHVRAVYENEMNVLLL